MGRRACGLTVQDSSLTQFKFDHHLELTTQLSHWQRPEAARVTGIGVNPHWAQSTSRQWRRAGSRQRTDGIVSGVQHSPHEHFGMKTEQLSLTESDWIFFSQFESNFAHFPYKLPRRVSLCPDGVSLCPELHHQPLFFTQPSQTPLGDMYVHKTPPIRPQNTPFPGLNLKVGKMNYSLGKMDPNCTEPIELLQQQQRLGSQ